MDNWQNAGQVHWSFQHMDELFRTTPISRGEHPPQPLPVHPTPLGDIRVTQPDGETLTVDEVMAHTQTDGWLLTHHGSILVEEYPSGMPPSTRHLLMSVSKSLVGAVAGVLVGRGVLDPMRPLTDYVPDLEHSGYAGALVRHVLDMRSGIRFSEEYLNPEAEVRLLEQAIDMAPRAHPGIPHTLYEFLLTLQQQRPHGGPFEYRSGETDILGWVCEAAAGARMPHLMSETLWSRLGPEEDAYIVVDRVGSGMFDGGICATVRDLARFGIMLSRGGISAGGGEVVPHWWVEDTLRGDSDTRQAFADSPTHTLMPGGMYRNQFWLPYPDRDILVCLGIHGQLIYINPGAQVVGVKLSSWPEPQHVWKLFSTLRAFDTMAGHLAGHGL
jgi:CubicO group peptidase (beta-lactamase class C family)